MLNYDNDVQRLKYHVLREVCKSAWKGTLKKDVLKIPEIVCPGPGPTTRCCVYKERAIVSERILKAMGGDEKNPNVVEVIKIACDECPIGGYQVVEHNCRGCIAHNCIKACKMNAITYDPIAKRCHIDKTKCVNCGMCANACKFHAIIDFERPCENACKVKAISPDIDHAAHIDNEKCIRCGACVYSCPFGAIVDKSQVVDIIECIKESDFSKKFPVYAIVAPAFASQIQGETIPQLISGIKHIGFADVIETAAGADIVARDEAKELEEKGFLTSSCCPAFVNYIKAYFPQLKDNISSNPSPMVALSKALKEKEPNCKICFIGPCIAKKDEARKEENSKYIDFVMTFEEMIAMLKSRDVHVVQEIETPVNDATCYGRAFARLGGVSEAVVQSLKEQNINFEVKGVQVDGIQNIKIALTKAQQPTRDFNFIEGMMCQGGCIGGPANINHELKDKNEIDAFAKTSTKTSILESAKEAEEK